MTAGDVQLSSEGDILRGSEVVAVWGLFELSWKRINDKKTSKNVFFCVLSQLIRLLSRHYVCVHRKKEKKKERNELT